MENILIDLTAVLRTTPQRWNALTQAFSGDTLRRRPAVGEWSALECLQHLIDLDRAVFPVRVKALLAEQNFPAYYPDQDGTPWTDDVSPTTLAAQFEAVREENLKLLEQVTLADMDRTGAHAELGMVTLSNLLHEWGGHDLMHLVQAEQALMQPFIEGCGAWQVYFSKHVVNDS